MSKMIFTIDWEDFGQLSNLYEFGKILPAKKTIEKETDNILSKLDTYNIKATFFILGMLAKERPDLVKLIEKEGHEIALHGNNHKSLPSQSREEIKEDIRVSKDIVTQIIGRDVYGYRAPFFSMTKERLFVLEDLHEMGFIYDSSIFPASLARYYIPGFEDKASRVAVNDETIVEIPMSCQTLGKYQVGVTGGGYFRCIPLPLLKSILNKRIEEEPLMFYFHPYEFNTDRLDVQTYEEEGLVYPKLKRMKQNFTRNLFHATLDSKLNFALNAFSGNSITCLEYANEVKNNLKTPVININ